MTGEKGRRSGPPVVRGQPAGARPAAQQFLDSYLRCAYGHHSAFAASAVAPQLRHQLRCDGPEVTPVDRRRRPKVGAVQLSARRPGVVIATATIEDGGITVYPLRFTLIKQAGRWVVDDVAAG